MVCGGKEMEEERIVIFELSNCKKLRGSGEMKPYNSCGAHRCIYLHIYIYIHVCVRLCTSCLVSRLHCQSSILLFIPFWARLERAYKWWVRGGTHIHTFIYIHIYVQGMRTRSNAFRPTTSCIAYTSIPAAAAEQGR